MEVGFCMSPLAESLVKQAKEQRVCLANAAKWERCRKYVNELERILDLPIEDVRTLDRVIMNKIVKDVRLLN